MEDFMTDTFGSEKSIFTCDKEEYIADQVHFDAAVDNALSLGLTVVVAKGNQLFLDLDTLLAKEQFLRMIPVFDKYYGPVEWVSTYSKSRNVHVVVTMPGFIAEDKRIALQAVLGSDPKKEMAAVKRSLNGVQDVVRLFRPNPTEDAAIELMKVSESMTPQYP